MDTGRALLIFGLALRWPRCEVAEAFFGLGSLSYTSSAEVPSRAEVGLLKPVLKYVFSPPLVA